VHCTIRPVKEAISLETLHFFALQQVLLIQATRQSFETQRIVQNPSIQEHKNYLQQREYNYSQIKIYGLRYAPHVSALEAQCPTSSSNDKDPPCGLRRASKLDDIEAILDASLQKPQTCNEWCLNEEFAKYYWSLPCDEDYYLLLKDCKEKYYVLKTSPCPCTFGEVLRTSGPVPPYLMSVECPAHTDEPKSFQSAMCSSPHASTPPSKLTMPAALLPALNKATALLTNEKTQEGWLPNQDAMPTIKALHALRQMNTARIRELDENRAKGMICTSPRASTLHTLSYASLTDPSSTSNAQQNDNVSSISLSLIFNVQEPSPRLQNEMSKSQPANTRATALRLAQKDMNCLPHTSLCRNKAE
jgi:hypothetical protein